MNIFESRISEDFPNLYCNKYVDCFLFCNLNYACLAILVGPLSQHRDRVGRARERTQGQLDEAVAGAGAADHVQYEVLHQRSESPRDGTIPVVLQHFSSYWLLRALAKNNKNMKNYLV